MLQISYQDRDGVRIVLLKGEAGVAEAQELSTIMIELAASRPKKLVFDLSGLTFVSSLALGEMAALADSLRRFEGHLAIAAPTPFIAGAIRRVRLDKSYDVFDSLEAAVAGLNNQGPHWFVLKQPAGSRPTATS